MPSYCLDTFKKCLDEKDALEGGGQKLTKECLKNTIRSHDFNGENYAWLEKDYGRVMWVDFQEPADTGKWRIYDRYWWARHALAVDHNPDRLVDSHVAIFVNPKTRSIRLRFWIYTKSGCIRVLEPTRHFYELEAAHFKAHHLCDDVPKTKKTKRAHRKPRKTY